MWNYNFQNWNNNFHKWNYNFHNSYMFVKKIARLGWTEWFRCWNATPIIEGGYYWLVYETIETDQTYSSSCVHFLRFNWFMSFIKHLKVSINKHKFASLIVYIYANSICDYKFRLIELTRRHYPDFTLIKFGQMTCIR